MRLWDYRLLPYLPKSQILAEWRELNSIFKKEDKHILINYIYEYDKKDLYYYSILVIGEMIRRKMTVRNLQNMQQYFNLTDEVMYLGIPNADKFKLKEPVFKNHHTDRYLIQCFYNLQEKFDRGQKDFSKEEYINLQNFIRKTVNLNEKVIKL